MNKIQNPLKKLMTAGMLGLTLAASARADEGSDFLLEAQKNHKTGQYYTAARYGYAASQAGAQYVGQGNSWAAISLLKAGLPQSAVFFFIKTLVSGDQEAIRRVLTKTETLLSQVGADELREYLVKYTTLADYDALNQSAYLFALGKSALLKADENRAIDLLNRVRPESTLYPYSLLLRGTALAIQGRHTEAIDDFKDCQKYAELVVADRDTQSVRREAQRNEAADLRARCQAGEARTLYQSNRFEEADDVYDRILKSSLVWPDTLFEQAWNAFARREFNRSLGKLVSYESPALKFVFNSEIDVLRAQSYLSLCLYEDTDRSLGEFEKKYATLGREVKQFVEQNAGNVEAFYRVGLDALHGPMTTQIPLHQMANGFVRAPFFRGLVAQDASLEREKGAIAQFSRLSGASSGGMTAFLGETLKWRRKAIHTLGGTFVKNSLIDHHTQLVSDFEKVSFIRLEMLSRQKEKLVRETQVSSAEAEEGSLGNIRPARKDHQLFWSFNGEFWNDELGDYVFGLESQCEK